MAILNYIKMFLNFREKFEDMDIPNLIYLSCQTVPVYMHSYRPKFVYNMWVMYAHVYVGPVYLIVIWLLANSCSFNYTLTKNNLCAPILEINTCKQIITKNCVFSLLKYQSIFPMTTEGLPSSCCQAIQLFEKESAQCQHYYCRMHTDILLIHVAWWPKIR